MSSELATALLRELEPLEAIAEESAMHLKSPALNDVMKYIEARLGYELARCGTLTDEIELRRAQGCVSAWSDVLKLLKHVPVEKRRTTSRQEV